jgi:hypothetical protein
VLEIDATDFGHQEVRVGVFAQNRARRVGDRLRLQACGGYLVEQRPEAVIVIAIQHHDIDIGARELGRDLQPAEAGADHYYARAATRSRHRDDLRAQSRLAGRRLYWRLDDGSIYRLHDICTFWLWRGAEVTPKRYPAAPHQYSLAANIIREYYHKVNRSFDG